MLAQNTLQGGVAGKIALGVGNEPVIELHQQPLFLEVIAEIASLGVMLQTMS